MKHLNRFVLAVLWAAFFIASAQAQNPGTVTNHAFVIGKGAGTTGYTSLLCTSAQLAVGQSSADPICRTMSGDATLAASGALTLATVNSNVGTFGSATKCTAFTTNAKGLITAASETTCTPALASITGLGTGVATALAVNVGTAGSFVVNGGALGTPSSGTATNLTGLPISSGVSGLGTGVATALGVNVGSAGAFVTFNGALGTPSSGTVTNLTGTASININGTVGATTPAAGTFTSATANSFVPNLSTIPSNGMYLPAANTLGWGINSAAEMQLTSTALSPAVDGGNSLGTTALGWQNLFGNTGFVFNIEGGDWVATHTAGILTVGTGDLRVTTAGTNSASAVTVGGSQTLTSKTLTTPTISAPTISGLANLSGAIKYSTQSAPSQITSNQNDYNPSSVNCATSTTLLINSDAARDITGLAGGVAGCQMVLVNNGSFTITLKEQSASSTAANRFNTGGDVALAANASVTLLYDGTASRWRMTSPANAGGGGGVTSVVVAAGNGISLSGTCTVTTSGTCTVTNSGVVTVKKQTFTASGTYTPSPGMIYAIIECIGAGGGGGSSLAAAGSNYSGGGGGAGGYSWKLATASDIGASKTVTVGSGGSGGATNSNNGAAGSSDTCVTSSSCSSGQLCNAKPGSGGQYGSVAQVPLGGAGGVAGTGDVAGTGAPGIGGYYEFNSIALYQPSGNGGSSIFGGGGAGVIAAGGTGVTGNNGGGYGSGGGGGAASNAAVAGAGGNGANGFILITEFNSQ